MEPQLFDPIISNTHPTRPVSRSRTNFSSGALASSPTLSSHKVLRVWMCTCQMRKSIMTTSTTRPTQDMGSTMLLHRWRRFPCSCKEATLSQERTDQEEAVV